MTRGNKKYHAHLLINELKHRGEITSEDPKHTVKDIVRFFDVKLIIVGNKIKLIT